MRPSCISRAPADGSVQHGRLEAEINPTEKTSCQQDLVHSLRFAIDYMTTFTETIRLSLGRRDTIDRHQLFLGERWMPQCRQRVVEL